MRIARNAPLLLRSITIEGIISVTLLKKEINLGKNVEIIGIRLELGILHRRDKNWLKVHTRVTYASWSCVASTSRCRSDPPSINFYQLYPCDMYCGLYFI